MNFPVEERTLLFTWLLEAFLWRLEASEVGLERRPASGSASN